MLQPSSDEVHTWELYWVKSAERISSERELGNSNHHFCINVMQRVNWDTFTSTKKSYWTMQINQPDTYKEHSGDERSLNLGAISLGMNNATCWYAAFSLTHKNYFILNDTLQFLDSSLIFREHTKAHTPTFHRVTEKVVEHFWKVWQNYFWNLAIKAQDLRRTAAAGLLNGWILEFLSFPPTPPPPRDTLNVFSV